MPFDGPESPLDDLAKFDQVVNLIQSPDRWTKGVYRGPQGQYCLTEALNIFGIAETFEPAILKVAAAAMDREFCCIESFNDWPETTHRDVVSVLWQVRKVAAAGRFSLPARPFRPPALGRGEAKRDRQDRGFSQYGEDRLADQTGFSGSASTARNHSR